MLFKSLISEKQKICARKDRPNIKTQLVIGALTFAEFPDHASVVRRSDSAIQWIAIFSTFVKLAVVRYNLRLRFGIFKLKFFKIYCRVQIRSFTALRLVLRRLLYSLSGG